MKVILITPQYHQPRGNTVTVDRISRGLNRLGITTEIVSVTDDNFPELPHGDLVHGFNAYQFHRYWRVRGSKSLPYMITLTGTDLNYNLFDKDTKQQVIQTLNDAKAVHVFNNKAKDLLGHMFPGYKDKLFLIPQGIYEFPYAECKVQKEEENFVFVLPAGIRQIKNIPSAISMLATLRKHDSRIRLWIVGPIIEEAEWHKVSEMIEHNTEWIRYLGKHPHQEMGAIYCCADVVLNTSLAEGQSSAILEAMCMEIPLLVSNVTGNQDIVSHGENGFLYHDEDDFLHYARELMENVELRKKMVSNGKEYAKSQHSAEKEIQVLTNIYRQILKRKTCLSNA